MDSISGQQLDRLLHDARAGDDEALGRLMEVYRNYVAMLARLQINHRLRGKVSPSDVVQETFLEARRRFAQFRGSCEGELVAWLRAILASRLAGLVRHYSAGRRNVHLEQQLDAELSGWIWTSHGLRWGSFVLQNVKCVNVLGIERSERLCGSDAPISSRCVSPGNFPSGVKSLI